MARNKRSKTNVSEGRQINASRAKQIWHRDIVSRLRAKILDGTFSEGQQLPTYVELEKQFHSTPRTVSKALEVLQLHGFIRTEKRRGMFVAENLPHRSHYALVFASKQDEGLSQFYRALRNEAARFENAGRRFSIFYNITEHTDTEDYQHLLGLVRSHRLAGLIFAQGPFYGLEGSPLVEEPGIPRVMIATEPGRPGMPAVYPDLHAFLPKALDYIAARGWRRVALIRKADNYPWPPPGADDFLREVANRGMVTHPRWIQSCHHDTPLRANELMQLLMSAPPGERPDAVIIRDDNLVEHATAGLIAAGIRVPGEVEVVAHGNFPWLTPSAAEVRRLGYDIRQLFELCVERADALRRGEPTPEITLLPALFEEELAIKKPVVKCNQ